MHIENAIKPKILLRIARLKTSTGEGRGVNNSPTGLSIDKSRKISFAIGRINSRVVLEGRFYARDTPARGIYSCEICGMYFGIPRGSVDSSVDGYAW